MQAQQNNNVNVTVNKDEVFAQDEFKSELKEKAEAHMDTAAYLWEEHKGVARDAAAMAASKSCDFAKAAESGECSGSTDAEMDKELLLLKDKAVETLVSAKATLGVAKEAVVLAFDEAKDATLEAYDATVETLAHAYDVSKEKTVQAYGWTSDKIEVVLEEAKEKTSEALEWAGEKMKSAGDLMVDRAEKIAPSTAHISEPMRIGPLSNDAFKEELESAAAEHNSSAGYQWEAHKVVARDAAAMAASKSSDFAKAADGSADSSAEGYIDIAKEKIVDTVDFAKEKSMATVDFAKEKSMAAYGWTGEKIEGMVEGAKEKTGEALEYIGDKMKATGGAMMDKGIDAKAQGIEMQDKAAAPMSV